MKQSFNNATIKIYFTAASRCRNLYNVTEMDKVDDVLRILSHGEVILLNWNNITTVEVLEDLK